MRFTPSQAGEAFLKPGRHVLTIGETFKRGTASSGKKFIEVKFKSANGGSVKDTFYLTDAALFRLANLLDLVGFNMDNEIDTDDDGDMRTALGGKVVGVIVAKEEYTKADGTTGLAARVKGYFDAAEGAGVNGSKQAAAQLDEDAPF